MQTTLVRIQRFHSLPALHIHSSYFSFVDDSECTSEGVEDTRHKEDIQECLPCELAPQIVFLFRRISNSPENKIEGVREDVVWRRRKGR